MNVERYLQTETRMAEAVRKIHFTRTKQIAVKNGKPVYTEEQEISYDPVEKILHNYKHFSEEERENLQFLAAPNFLSMN